MAVVSTWRKIDFGFLKICDERFFGAKMFRRRRVGKRLVRIRRLLQRRSRLNDVIVVVIDVVCDVVIYVDV